MLAELLVRFTLWVALPGLLVVAVVGPRRSWRAVKRLGAWLNDTRQDPADVLNRVVREHERNIRLLKDVLAQSEAAQSEIFRNTRKSEDNIIALELEARTAVAHNDDLGARAALYKLHLERHAVAGFKDQLARLKERIDQARRRLHLLELQLRQYEVGRTILLAQLAEAKTVEQQYALASQFDPFSAVAEWSRAEGSVHQAANAARAVERVLADTADLPLGGAPVRLDPALLDQQLAELKARARPR